MTKTACTRMGATPSILLSIRRSQCRMEATFSKRHSNLTGNFLAKYVEQPWQVQGQLGLLIVQALPVRVGPPKASTWRAADEDHQAQMGVTEQQPFERLRKTTWPRCLGRSAWATSRSPPAWHTRTPPMRRSLLPPHGTAPTRVASRRCRLRAVYAAPVLPSKSRPKFSQWPSAKRLSGVPFSERQKQPPRSEASETNTIPSTGKRTPKLVTHATRERLGALPRPKLLPDLFES